MYFGPSVKHSYKSRWCCYRLIHHTNSNTGSLKVLQTSWTVGSGLAIASGRLCPSDPCLYLLPCSWSWCTLPCQILHLYLSKRCIINYLAAVTAIQLTSYIIIITNHLNPFNTSFNNLNMAHGCHGSFLNIIFTKKFYNVYL